MLAPNQACLQKMHEELNNNNLWAKQSGRHGLVDYWKEGRTNKPSQEAVRKSMLESYTMPNPWCGTVSLFAPEPTVKFSNATLPATAPVP